MANRPRAGRPTRETPPGRERAPATTGEGRSSLEFSAVNLALGAAGLVALALGYWLLASGSVTAAPLLLVLGYVVLLPLALIL
jgi:hypothetical protein